MPWGDWLKQKFWEVTHKKPVKIPLLPENQKKVIVRSNGMKRRLPIDFVKKGPAKRARGPAPPDPRPDSGRDYDKGLRVFRRPIEYVTDEKVRAQTTTVWALSIAHRAHLNILRACLPNGWERIPLPQPVTKQQLTPAGQKTYMKLVVGPPDTGLTRGIWTVMASLDAQYGAQFPKMQKQDLELKFREVLSTWKDTWLELRLHKGVEDTIDEGPWRFFGDQMAGALFKWGQDFYGLDLALGIIDSKCVEKPFVHPLPTGHNHTSHVVWVFYDSLAARWRPTPPRRDQAWREGDFDYWWGVREYQEPEPKPDDQPDATQDTGNVIQTV